MKKLPLLLLALTLLSACDKGKSDLETALTNSYRDDQDLKDYNIAPERMAQCVADAIAGTLSGFPGTPERQQKYAIFSKFITVVADKGDPTAVLEEANEVFGSARETRQAFMGITAHNLQCMGDLIEGNGAPEPKKPAADKM